MDFLQRDIDFNNTRLRLTGEMTKAVVVCNQARRIDLFVRCKENG